MSLASITLGSKVQDGQGHQEVHWDRISTNTADSKYTNSELHSYVVNKIETMKRTHGGVRRLAQLAAFIPDFVLRDDLIKIPSFTTCEAVVYVADISGFTALTEAYSLKGNGGTDQLSKILSEYMGPLIESILGSGGDIVKYAGDAFLAIWKVHDNEKMPQLLNRVVECALYQQTHFGEFQTELNITIQVKIGIGTGTIHCALIGNQENHHWVCFGPGVRAASEAEKHCSSKDIILHPSGWEHLSSEKAGKKLNFSHEIKSSDKGVEFYRIFRSEKDQKVTSNHLSNIRIPGITDDAKISTKSKVFNISAHFKMEKPTIHNHKLRGAIGYAIDKRSEAQMRHFVIFPVLKKLDDDIPIEYLNESRLVSICFIHMDIESIDSDNFGKTMSEIVQKGFRYIQRCASIMQGCLTKIIMFDKGLTYLLVFGLPGYIHDNQSSNALKFSYKVKSLLLGVRHVRRVSLGIATGSTYCGVLGHKKRHEYTVIGRKVNKAARLMINYPGKLTCDQDTMYHSKLPVHYFHQLESVALKGISNVGKIYEFLNAEGGEDHTVKSFHYPMLGRESELNFFKDTLESAKLEFLQFLTMNDANAKVHLSQTSHSNVETVNLIDLQKLKEAATVGIWMLVFEGDHGIGKSRLLASCIEEAQGMDMDVFTVGMNMLFAAQRNFAIKSLLIQAFGMENLRTPQEKEEHLRKHVGDPELAANLCLVNEIFNLKFPTHPRFMSTDINTRRLYAQHIVSQLIRQFYENKLILFVVDDAHLLDVNSWEFLQFLSRSPKVFILLSLRRSNSGTPRIPDIAGKIVYQSKNVKCIRLTGLHSNFSVSLSCQLLEVRAIPADLERILIAKGKGVPAWYAQVLRDFVRNGILKIIPFDEEYATNYRMRFADNFSITKIPPSAKKEIKGHEWHDHISEITEHQIGQLSQRESVNLENKRLIPEKINPKNRMCVVKPDTDLRSMPIPGTLREIVLDSFDELPFSEQLLLKCASVLGIRFSRLMLSRILPLFDINAKKYENGLQTLFELNLLHCGTAKQSFIEIEDPDSEHVIECNCIFTREELKPSKGDAHEGESLPKYYKCKYMEFSKESMQEVVYELMTDDQKKEFHLKAAKYLDSSLVRCQSCGGEDSSYLFGINRRNSDFSSADNEEAAFKLKALNKKGKASSRPEHDRRKSKQYGKNTLHFRLDSLRKSLEGSATRLTLIELDIFKVLEDFNRKEMEMEGGIFRKNKFFPCSRNKSKTPDPKSIEEVREYEKSVKRKEVEEEEVIEGELDPEKDSNADKKVQIVDQKDVKPAFGSREKLENNDLIDMRSCECAAVQSRVCVELVRHYRSSEKYGKCLINLLEAAESAITIGNGTQALVHLEDALGLLNALDVGKLSKPKENDADDIQIDRNEFNLQMEFLNGLAYFELGIFHRAREYFIKALGKLGVDIPSEERKLNRDQAIKAITMKLWKLHHFSRTGKKNKLKMDRKYKSWAMKYRILSYLHLLYKIDRNMDMALLMALWQAHIAELFGNFIEDIIPAYCNIMGIYSMVGNHKKAREYEKLSLQLIRENYGHKEQMETFGLLTTSNLFLSVSLIRLKRGELASSVDASYLALRIAFALHDNLLSLHIYPVLFHGLIMRLRITELIEILQKLWYTAEEEQDWSGSAAYYTLCLDLLLNTAYPIEPFFKYLPFYEYLISFRLKLPSSCENFATRNDWSVEILMFREFEIQFNLESGLALWFARYSRWEASQLWVKQAELHRPKNQTFLSISGDLKLLECQLLFVYHYLENKRYQHFSIAKIRAKNLMRNIKKSLLIAPVYISRFEHLLSYYCRILSRFTESDMHLKRAQKSASRFGNLMELEWIKHSHSVWTKTAIPTVKNFWMEHTESNTLDWHLSGKIPWMNIMYSLPLPNI